MRYAVTLLQAAGLVQIGIAAANPVLARKLRLGPGLAGLRPVLRQVFLVHWAYIVYVLLLFAALSIGFAEELVSGTPLARFLCAGLALFWLPRPFLQVFYYDPAFRRESRLGDAAMVAATLGLGVVYALGAFGGLAALGVPR